MSLPPRISFTWWHDGRQRPMTWTDVERLPLTNFDLVCCGGGATGASFHAGVLLAMHHDHGIELRRCRRIIGTSSGAIAGSLIGLGFDGSDLAAVVNDAHEWLHPDLRAFGAVFRADIPDTPGPLALLRWSEVSSWLRCGRRLATGQVRAALLQALRAGTFDLREALAFLLPIEWSHLRVPLEICAVSATTGRRLVMDSGSGHALIDAVTASCAVPAVMQPVHLDGVPHVDGGVYSPSNADLLANGDGDVPAVIISPMSGTGAHTAVGRSTAWYARTRLRQELARLSPSRPVLVVEPAGRLAGDVIDELGADTRAAQIVSETFLSASLS